MYLCIYYIYMGYLFFFNEISFKKKYYDKNIYKLFDNLVVWLKHILRHIILSFLLIRRKTIYFRKYISIIFIENISHLF